MIIRPQLRHVIESLIILIETCSRMMSIEITGAKHFTLVNEVYIYPELGANIVIKYNVSYNMYS